MHSLISELAAFVRDGSLGVLLAEPASQIGDKPLRGVGINLLSWLAARGRWKNQRKLLLNPEHTWCQTFTKLMNEYPVFSALFTAEGNEVDFAAQVSAEERAEIQRYAMENYKPPLMTK
jgi:hypothetical protein